MKKIKILLFLIVVALGAFVVYQNWAFFSAKNLFSVDFKFRSYTTPEIANGLLLLGFFVTGFIIAYISSLFGRFRSARMVKELNATIDSQQEKLASFRGEIETLKRELDAPAPAPQPPVEPEAAPEPETETTADKETEAEKTTA